MALNYEKIRRRVEEGSHTWTSYSDLFLVLSVVFLLLFVISNLRSGTMSIAVQSQMTTLKKESDELKKQIQAYNGIKDDYVQNGASQEELKNYEDLMGKLSLLQDEANQESKDALEKAKTAEEKRNNLNHYQALVKNIITANLVASAKVKKRDLIIQDQDHDIEGLNDTVVSRETQIEQNNQKISRIQQDLVKQIKEVKYANRSKKHSQEKSQAEIARLTQESNSRIAALNQQSTLYSEQLNDAKSKLEQKNREAEQLLASMNQKEAEYEASIQQAKAAHDAKMAQEKAAYEAQLAQAQLTGEQKLAQERAYAAAVENKNRMFQDEIAGINRELDNTRHGIKDIENKYQGSIKSLRNANSALEKDLVATQDKLDAQRKLASQLRKNFADAGIDASVDGKTGDVTINFQNEYFDTGRADLKNGMKSILEKTIPVYAKSLLSNPKIASRISAVEIVGFASPTYQGKAVDPESLSPDNRIAVNYNMDLSYQRAKAIFEHIFDTSKMQFDHQKELLPMVKVSGRSYLATDKISGRKPAGAGGQNYCDVYDCKKSQRVIIRFNLKDE